jgi:hypothetical protein
MDDGDEGHGEAATQTVTGETREPQTAKKNKTHLGGQHFIIVKPSDFTSLMLHRGIADNTVTTQVIP